MKQREHQPDAFEAALLEERPEIPPDFAAKLDAWAAEGFPPAEGAPIGASPWDGVRRRLSTVRLGNVLAPAAALATALVALVIGINALSEPDNGEDSGAVQNMSLDSGATGGEASRGPTAEAPARDSTDIAPDPTTVPPIDDFSQQRIEQIKPGQDRIQEKTVTTTLSTEPDAVDDVSDGVVEVTERYDGIVASSNVNTTGDRGRAVFALRVPTQNLQAFQADLSDLASVTARNEGTLDITAPFISAEERFDDAKAEVDALVAQLADADSAAEIAEAKLRLSSARATLAAVRADLAELKQRADFSRVSVTVVGDGDSDGWSLGDAADDALSVLSDIAGAALVALAVILPFGAIALAIAFATRKLRRRRRESALDD